MHARVDKPLREGIGPFRGRIFLGALLTVCGAAIFGAILFIADDRSAFSERMFFRLGLALMALISMVGQVMAILGLEMFFQGLARRRTVSILSKWFGKPGAWTGASPSRASTTSAISGTTRRDRGV
jgi:hypothetical protein